MKVRRKVLLGLILVGITLGFFSLFSKVIF